MSRATPDDQLKFLLSCVKHSNNGKIDFVEVAKDCGIVSKGAAAKRYERLMKANGIHPSGGPSERLAQQMSPPKEKSKAAIAKAAASKKRKIEGDLFDGKYNGEDDIKPIVPKVEPRGGQHLDANPRKVFAPYAYPDMAISQALPYFPSIASPPVINHTPYSRIPSLKQNSSCTFNNDNSFFDEFCSPDLLWQTSLKESKPEMALQTELPIRLPPSPQEVLSSNGASNLINKSPEMPYETLTCILIPD